MNKKVIVVVALVSALLGMMVGASYLYNKLSDGMESTQLAATATPQPTEEAPGATATPQDEVPPVTDSEPEDFPAPDFTAYDADGNAVQLSDYFGKPLVLNFWASWCGPCKSEMPHFDAVCREMGEEVTFLMVNMTTSSRESEKAAKDYIAEAGFAFPVLYDLDSEAAITYGVNSLPTTYFLDADGNLITYATGAISESLLRQGIDIITE